jgi:MoaA/NifB/PqqE/SkfB family radical SAM enzyme
MKMGYLYRRIYEGVNYRLPNFCNGLLDSFCRPVSISILLTERCSAKCVHCDIWKNRGKEDSPDLSVWKQLLSDLRTWLGPVQVTVTGGEALLKPYTIELLEHGFQLGLFMELLTHGSWDDQSKFERLARSNPGRVTISLDGIGVIHSRIRGREGFFEKTHASISTLLRVREQENLQFSIRFKTVIMDQNIAQLVELARYATNLGAEIFYQPIEQNYNTVQDPEWYKNSGNWPKDIAATVAAIEELQYHKRCGLNISNSFNQLEVMAEYFRSPDLFMAAVQRHDAHQKKRNCSALTLLQVQANGDVLACIKMPAIGNIRCDRIASIWAKRPTWWKLGCCLERN